MGKKHISGLIFLGTMFITVGILHLLGYSGWYAWVLSAGVGFIFSSFAKLYEKRRASGTMFAGVLLFFAGLFGLLGLDSCFFIGIGIAFIILALFRIYEQHQTQKGENGFF